ncbi:hypothetical protein COEREDRAFT_83099 [Coemansia reversa NRRL 1564]|uniref:DUF2470 domain-containing protein n=1 Tax=Coemansia reversa (strain ATCC 12441 / NRRL 1564) TaxID=763665 RepID=A0A2G5B5A8_COERN|nr:hypothetical protein COEREDRAFT_83099 [Coemansia reversa NRRL 1564]|eukprot:PIA13907.1 hypothetical protein COEREDRAFT_83099 [Coemansia reversa NRRL 1564]
MAQQQAKTRQRRNVLSATESEKLKVQLNTNYSDDLLRIAKYFGKQPKAYDARVIDIDNNGVTIEWEWIDKNSETSNRQIEDMQFALRDFSGTSSVLQEISDLASEASTALGESQKPKLTRDKEALDAKNLVDFTFVPPGILSIIGVMMGIALLTYMSFISDVHPTLQFIRKLISQDACYYVFVAVMVIHFVEACVTYAACELIKTFQPRQMTTETQIKWTIGGLLFGVFCLHAFVSKLMRQFALAEAMPGPDSSRRSHQTQSHFL